MSTHVATRTDLQDAVAAAVRAPSIHNTQPWLFRLHNDAIDVYADPARQLRVTDPTGTALRLSCGAAILHLRLAVAVMGHRPQSVLLPDARDPDLLARVSIGPAQPPTPTDTELYAAIERRYSNHSPFLDTDVPADARSAMVEAAKVEGSWLDVIVSPAAQSVIAELVRAADKVLRRDAGYRAELEAWLRADGSGPDGIPRRAEGPAPDPQDAFTMRYFGDPARAPVGDFEAHPFIAVLGGYDCTRRDDLIAGQALERVLLTATSHGLATSLISQPIDVPRLREQLRLGLRRPGPPHIVLRAGYGTPGCSPPRRPLADVLLPALPTGPSDAGR